MVLCARVFGDDQNKKGGVRGTRGYPDYWRATEEKRYMLNTGQSDLKEKKRPTKKMDKMMLK